MFSTPAFLNLIANSGTGSVTPPLPDPSQIFGSSNLKLWMDTSSLTGKTLSGPRGTMVDSLVSNDSNAYSFTNVAATKLRFCRSKWFPFFRDTEGLVNSGVSNFNALHDGTDFMIGFRIMIIRGLDDFYPIMVNNNSTSVQTGINVAYDNRSSSSRSHALLVNVTKGSSGNNVYLSIQNNFFTEGVWTTVLIVKSGTTLSLYRSTTSAAPTLVASVSRLNTPVTSNASQNLSVFYNPSAVKYMRNSLFKHLTVVTGAVTSDQREDFHDYVQQGDAFMTGSMAYVYTGDGQSNFQGDPTSPPTYLRNEIDCYIWGDTGNSGTDSTVFQKLQWPTNNATGNNSFGPELEFCYRMSLLKPGQVYLIKTSLSSTPLYIDPGNIDWNVASAGSEMAGRTRGAITRALCQLIYEFDLNVKMCGRLTRQGEADCLNGNATYETDSGNLTKNLIDVVYNPASAAGLLYPTGLTTSKMIHVVSLMDTVFTTPDRPFQSAVLASQQAYISDFKTDNPAYVNKIQEVVGFSTIDIPTSDGTHFTSDGMVTQGLRFYNAVAPSIDQ